MKKYYFLLMSMLLLVGFSACKPKNLPEEPKDQPEEISYEMTLEQKSVSLYVDETVTIKPTLTPAADNLVYTFKSSDVDVAKVNENGKVTAVGHGNASITVTALVNDRNVAQSKFRVEVVKDKVLLNEHELSLLKGKTATLTAHLDQAKKDVTAECDWQSSKTSVATVKGGKIEAVGKGECDITATYDGVTATCHVTVALDILLLSQTEIVMLEGGTANLTARLQNADKDVTSLCDWTSSKTDVATVSKGTIQALKPGDCTITASYDGITVNCRVTVGATLLVTPTEITLKEGKTQQLTANMDGVQYVSKNTSVATVSASGLVTAKSEGTTEIHATKGDMKVVISVTVQPVAKNISSSIPSAILVIGNQSSTKSLTISASKVTVTPASLNQPANIQGKITWSNGSTTTLTANASGWTAQLPATGSSNVLTGTLQWSVMGANDVPVTTSETVTLLAQEAQKSAQPEWFGMMGMTEAVEYDFMNLPGLTSTVWNTYLDQFVVAQASTSGNNGATITNSRRFNKLTINAAYQPTPCGVSGMRNSKLTLNVKVKAFNGSTVSEQSFGTYEATFYSSVKEHEVGIYKAAGGSVASAYETFNFSTIASATSTISMASGTYNAYKSQSVKVTWQAKYYTNASGSKLSAYKTFAEKTLTTLQTLYNSSTSLTAEGKTITVRINVL